MHKTFLMALAVLMSISPGWQLPFDKPHRLVRPYLQPNSDYSAGHRGVDYEVVEGEPVFAPADGTLTFAKVLVDRGVVAISHGSSWVSEVEPVCSELQVGAVVRKGQQIGTVCAASATYRKHCAEVTCLHFSLRLGGKYLSPLALIGGLSPTRLLPYARG